MLMEPEAARRTTSKENAAISAGITEVPSF
jgi:hypothetical protein